MEKPSTLTNEENRIKVLEEYQILDTSPEQAYDDLTFLASQICKTPVAVISLIDKKRQWFKSNYGMKTKSSNMVLAFCENTIKLPEEVFEVTDATLDDRFSENLIVKASPGVQFYAGAPLVNPDGFTLGTIFVMDYEPRELDESQRKALQSIARQVITQMELSKITKEQENREFEFKKDTELLEQSQALGSLGHWVADVREGTVFWSAETRVIHEVEKSYIPNLEEGINFYDKLSKPIITETVESAISNKKGWDVKLGIWTAKGNHKWVRSIGKVYLEKGEVTKLFGIFQDITEEKEKLDQLLQRENTITELNSDLEDLIQEKTIELKKTKKNYQELYDNAPNMMLSVDTSTQKVVACNATLLKKLEFKKEEFINKSLKQIYHNDCHFKLDAIFGKLIKQKKVEDERLVVVTKYGNEIPVSLSATVVENEKGEVISTNSIWRDITELVKAENLLKNANAKLEQRVFERTLQLKKANEELEEFTYIATHDLKSPLASIKGHLEIIDTEIDTSNEILKSSLFWANDSINLAERKIQSIIDVARLKFVNLKDREKINLFQLIKRVKGKLTQDLNSNIQKFNIRVESNVSLVSNKQYLEAALNNLIHNAVKYRREDVGLEVLITIKKDEQFIRILVSDNGLGIDLGTNRSKLFKMFSRLHDHVEGSGMGLYFSNKMIEHLGGEIEVESNLGEGSIFTIKLPH